ncbi:hypothetical protein [Nocardia noduli]|uniref:hypothetical protein n=1 Tax=Nocardia noduli TaxID=2815722 RepID=UPI001C24CD49|nr:hypothetical protein [Nocardia noduli]
MIDTFAWTVTLTGSGGTELAMIAASFTAAADPVAESVLAYPVSPEPRNRVRAGLINSDAGYPNDPYRLYRLGGSGHRPPHDLAVAVTVHQLALDPPWRGLLDHVVFLAEVGLDGRLRPSHPPHTLRTMIAAAARLEFRYALIAAGENTDDLDGIEGIEGITVVAHADLRGVLDWLEALPNHQPAAAASPELPGMRIAHNLDPARIRGGRAVLDGSGSDADRSPTSSTPPSKDNC